MPRIHGWKPVLSLAVLMLAVAGDAAAQSGRCGAHPWCDPSLAPAARADLLLAALTQQEKFQLMAGDDFTGVFNPPIGETHTGLSRGVERLDLPPILFTDGPAGVRQGSATAMPAPLGLAATFDPEAARRYGMVVGNEAKHKGNDVVFGPTVNIMRTPLGGRSFEGYGEDPFLTTRLAVAWIQGLQSEGVVGNVKHFAANNQETNRFTVNAVVDERTLREIYLPHFEAAVREAGVGTVMSAYNRLNGAYCSENLPLLTHVLKDEWGFDGFVLSDYTAQRSTVASALNGLELELPFQFFYAPPVLTLAVTGGLIPAAVIDEHIHRILRTMFRFGLFDRPAYPVDDALIDQAAHAAVADEVESAAIVLLKNAGGLLPLDAGAIHSIAVIGADADAYKSGGGSSNVTPFAFVSPRQGITDRAGPAIAVTYDPGNTPEAGAAAAAAADVAIVFASDNQTEFVDKPCLSLLCGNPARGDQDGLIDAVVAANPNTIVVLETGSPVLMPWVDRVPAILEAWYPGAMGGRALAAVLFGDRDPGGRLPVTFPRAESDKPANTLEQYPGVAENAVYSEGVFVGYRHYDRNAITPLFPFGHGLSYTSFQLRGLRVKKIRGSESVRVTLRVKNVGSRAGSTVVQLYLGLPEPAPSVPQPPRQLKGFRKVTLAPRKSARVTIDLDARAFSYWNVVSGDWRIAAGCYDVTAGQSSRDLPLRKVVGKGGAICKTPRP